MYKIDSEFSAKLENNIKKKRKMNIIMVLVELIPILLGIMFTVNVLNEYKQFGIIVEKLNEGEKCVEAEKVSKEILPNEQQVFIEREQALLKREQVFMDQEQAFMEKEQALLKREQALLKKEEFLLKREQLCKDKEQYLLKETTKKKSVSYTNSSEQYAKKLKTHFR